MRALGVKLRLNGYPSLAGGGFEAPIWASNAIREPKMTDLQFCKVEREGPLTIVTINRPEVMNAVHPPANFELAGVFDAFAADPEQWVAIVTGAGERAFSAGNDLKQPVGPDEEVVPSTGFAGLTARFDLT